MNDKSKDIDSADDRHKKTGRKSKGRMKPPTRGETLVKGVAMGIIISAVNHASRNITNTLIRHPLALFSMGVIGGYMTHKYRREIITIGHRTAEESKNFILRQKENLLDFVAESTEQHVESDKSK